MRKTLLAIAAAALMPASLHAASLNKGQICEKRAVKETYPVATRHKCNGGLTKECKRLTDEWLTDAALEKRKCLEAENAPNKESEPRTMHDALKYCSNNPDARESGRDDESFLSVRECANRIMH